MSTSFIEQTNQNRIDLHNLLLDDQNVLQGKIQQLIKNYGKDSADRRLREGYYAGRLEQLRGSGNNFVIWMKRSSKRHYPREVNTLHD